jgi:hypothetical protein
MPEATPNEPEGRGIGFWVMLAVFGVPLMYLFSFAVLVLVPQASRAAQATGLSNATLEKIYYPILRFLQ